MNDDENPILVEVEKEMDIVPYRRVDKWLTYAIYFLIITNALSVVGIVLIWGSL